MLICDKIMGLKFEGVMIVYLYLGEGVIYLVVFIEIDGIKMYVLFDIGVGSFYVLVKLIKVLNKRLKEMKIKRIDMMFGLIIIKVEIYLVIFKVVDSDFKMNIELLKV